MATFERGSPVTHPSAPVYVALPLDSPRWPERLQQAREALAGVEASTGGAAVAPHPSVPGEIGAVPTADELRLIGRRMLAGDGLIHARCCVLLAFGTDASVEEQVGWAEAEGIPVQRWTAQDLGRVRLLGAVAQPALSCPVTERDRDRLSVDAVIRLQFCGAESILGCRALPLPPPDGQGDRHARKNAIELCGLQLATVAGVFREARLHPDWRAETELVLRAAQEGYSFAEAARAAGLSGATAAWRLHDRARSVLGRILAERRRRDVSSGTSDPRTGQSAGPHAERG